MQTNKYTFIFYFTDFFMAVLKCFIKATGGVKVVKKFDFLILCLWSILVEADLVELKLAAKEITFTQKVRFTFSIEIEC